MHYAVDFEGHDFHDNGKRYATEAEAIAARDAARADGWHDASTVQLIGKMPTVKCLGCDGYHLSSTGCA